MHISIKLYFSEEENKPAAIHICDYIPQSDSPESHSQKRNTEGRDLSASVHVLNTSSE